MMPDLPSGSWMYDLACKLFPICRSITGPGFRQSLAILGRELPDLRIHAVPSGTAAFDWTIPPEWTIRAAYLIGPDGERICDLNENNLHVLGYSTAIDEDMPLETLQEHLYSLPDQPDAIPYMTSYYTPRWGFCLSHRQRAQLRPGTYRAVIDSSHDPHGVLNYADLVLPGTSTDEILISTYLCHPSMANNELSGPVLATALARYLQALPERRYTYRFVIIPETIGSLTYLSRHLSHLQEHVRAGFILTCVGDDRRYSYLPSRRGDTLADRVLTHVLAQHDPAFDRYSFLEYGSDERQYCSPLVDLPVASFMRSKYDTYPEYHTSLDNLDLVSAQGFAQSLAVMRDVVDLLECNHHYRATVYGEPQLGKRGLYPTLSTKETFAQVYSMMSLLAYADGDKDLIAIADTIRVPGQELVPIARTLLAHDLLEIQAPRPGS